MGNSKVFYTGNPEIYASKQLEGPYLASNKPAGIIKRLVEPVYISGCNIAENWFTDKNFQLEATFICRYYL